uniref:Uncharacterized protein n=1 Tax=Xenopus tropicalis TaxID=8364 RepID=A0A1B8Y064_XENTR
MASFKHVVSPPEELTNNRRPDLMASFKHVVSPPEEPTNYRRPDPMASFKHVVSPPEELTNNRRPDPMASFKHVVSPPEEPTNYRHPDPMASFNHVVSQEPERRLEKGSFHGRRDEDLSRLPQSEGFNVNNFALVGSQGQESVSSSPKELHNLFSEKEQELASSGQSSLPEELNSLAREATGQLSQFQQTLDSLQQNLSQAFQHGDGSSQSEKGDGETEPERDTEQDESTSTERPVTKRRQSNARRGSSQKGFLSKLREKTSAMKEKVSKGQGMRRHRRQRSLSGNFLDNITQSISKAKDSLMGLFDNLGSALKRRP